MSGFTRLPSMRSLTETVMVSMNETSGGVDVSEFKRLVAKIKHSSDIEKITATDYGLTFQYDVVACAVIKINGKFVNVVDINQRWPREKIEKAAKGFDTFNSLKDLVADIDKQSDPERAGK